MNGDKKLNGDAPSQNGVNGSDNAKTSQDKSKAIKGGKANKDKDSEEEMTVVVPPSKSSNGSNSVQQDGEGDVVMNGASEAEAKKVQEPVVDPKEKAIAGELRS